MVKEEANNNLNAKVDFGEFDLGLISTFPNFEFSINDVKVDGVDQGNVGVFVVKNGVENLCAASQTTLIELKNKSDANESISDKK